jgi:hypothetical protein
MANVKFTDLPSATALDGTEITAIVQGGVSVQTTAEAIGYSGKSYGSFCDVTDQTGNVSTPTAVKFGTNIINSAGVTVVTDGSHLTRVTLADAGTYIVSYSLQCANSDTNDHDISIWLRLNGTDITNTGRKQTVPKAADGGIHTAQTTYTVVATAGQYVQVMWLPENVTVTLDHTAAAVGPPAVPEIPSSYVVVQRVA